MAGTINRLYSEVERLWSAGVVHPQLMHGDYKIENLVFDQASLKLVAVIDWDLADPVGLPYLDLWYLLIYNRYIRDRKNFAQTFVMMLLEDDLSTEERSLVDDYASQLLLDDQTMAALRALFILFHIGSRSDFGTAPEDVLGELERALRMAVNYCGRF